jgi:hypothetical protein
LFNAKTGKGHFGTGRIIFDNKGRVQTGYNYLNINIPNEITITQYEIRDLYYYNGVIFKGHVTNGNENTRVGCKFLNLDSFSGILGSSLEVINTTNVSICI